MGRCRARTLPRELGHCSPKSTPPGSRSRMAAAAAGTDEARIIHALNVMCRMDPARVGEDAARVASLLGEDAGEDFLETVDRPLAVAKCASTGKTYIKCDYNRDGDSHR